MQIPPYLKPGDTIGVAATARKVTAAEIESALHFAKLRGYNVALAENVYKADNQYSGNDAQRAKGLNNLLHNPDVKAIWCARGGYGSVRLLNQIDWAYWRKNPKWICGFSDVTAIHLHLQKNLNMASLHSEMMLGFDENSPETHNTMWQTLEGTAPKYAIQNHELNRAGQARGELIGGNLSVLYSMLGSPTQPDTKSKILFLEDLDEYLYHIDRMMMALDRARLLANLAGLVVGGMSGMHDNKVPFGKSAEEIVADVVDKYDYPVCFNVPAGHIANNCALIMGAETTLSVAHETTLKQHLP